jgi:hypothetical protein
MNACACLICQEWGQHAKADALQSINSPREKVEPKRKLLIERCYIFANGRNLPKLIGSAVVAVEGNINALSKLANPPTVCFDSFSGALNISTTRTE